MRRLQASVVAGEHASGPVLSWMESFLRWAGPAATFDTPTKFYQSLAVFLGSAVGKRFNTDIDFQEDGTIGISRVHFFHQGTVDVKSSIQALEDVRDSVESSTLEPKPFAFSKQHTLTEQFLVIKGELATNFLLVLAAVFGLSLLILGYLRHALLAVALIAVVDFEILGSIYYWQLEVSSITGIALIMAVGLVVDYQVHTLFYFLHQDPTISREERAAAALVEVGASVFQGGCTTFLSILALAFSGNQVFRVFFRMFFSIVVLAVIHGLVVLPVLLTFIPVSDDEQVASPKASTTPKVVTPPPNESQLGVTWSEAVRDMVFPTEEEDVLDMAEMFSNEVPEVGADD
ncbi:unnamed protein product [Chrysoparadoxa australica]